MMTAHYPLSSHQPEEAIAYGPQGAISTGQFIAQVLAVAQNLPAAQYVVNICANRYHFLLGFAAAVVAGKTTLMPSTVTEQVLLQLGQNYPQDLALLHDTSSTVPAHSLPAVDLGHCVQEASSYTAHSAIPPIAAEHLAAIVFTSGSTGEPVPHRKSWGSLVHNTQAAATRLSTQGLNILATVPGQHMYGFESSVLLALLGGCAIWHEKPLFPADISAALAQIPAPRMLVSTPFHLNTCIQSALPWPTMQLILSATAPLGIDLAQQVEEQMQAPLHEIFGSTDTNQIATRRTLAGARWQLLDWVQLTQQDGQTFVHGICLPQPMRIGDGIALQGKREFELLGRDTDQLNIAGKRNSLANMNQLLMRIPGVQDGCFFMPTPQEAAQHDPLQVLRPCAFVVAPGLSAQTIREQLRQHVDPVFLPRPVWFVDQLPRNAASKLPRSALLALYQQHSTKPGAAP
ncbi:MAG: AMP-binding protein [Comamonas sp.]